MSTFIRFDKLVCDGRKTAIWTVRTVDCSSDLGQVKWFGRWRCYAFFPDERTVFEKVCLRDIAAFCERETEAHRKKARG